MPTRKVYGIKMISNMDSTTHFTLINELTNGEVSGLIEM